MNYIVNYIALHILIFQKPGARTRKYDLSHFLHGIPAIHSNAAEKIYASNRHSRRCGIREYEYLCAAKMCVARLDTLIEI